MLGSQKAESHARRADRPSHHRTERRILAQLPGQLDDLDATRTDMVLPGIDILLFMCIFQDGENAFLPASIPFSNCPWNHFGETPASPGTEQTSMVARWPRTQRPKRSNHTPSLTKASGGFPTVCRILLASKSFTEGGKRASPDKAERILLGSVLPKSIKEWQGIRQRRASCNGQICDSVFLQLPSEKSRKLASASWSYSCFSKFVCCGMECSTLWMIHPWVQLPWDAPETSQCNIVSFFNTLVGEDLLSATACWRMLMWSYEKPMLALVTNPWPQVKILNGCHTFHQEFVSRWKAAYVGLDSWCSQVAAKTARGTWEVGRAIGPSGRPPALRASKGPWDQAKEKGPFACIGRHQSRHSILAPVPPNHHGLLCRMIALVVRCCSQVRRQSAQVGPLCSWQRRMD